MNSISSGVSLWVRLTIVGLTLVGSYFVVSSITTLGQSWALGLLLLFVCCTFTVISDHARRLRQVVLILMFVVILILTFLVHQHLAMLFLVVCLIAVESLPRRLSIVWIGMCVLAVFVCEVFDGRSETGLQDAIVNSFITLLVSGFAILRVDAEIGRKRTRKLVRELEIKNKKLAIYAAEHEYQSRLKERQRLSRELHDTLGHKLTTSIVQMEAAEKLVEEQPGRAKGMIRDSQSLLREGLEETRDMVRFLDHDSPGESFLSRDLSVLVKSFQSATGLAVDLRLKIGESGVSSEVKRHIFRIVQESLTNISRHAKATEVCITLTHDKIIRLLIEDNGQSVIYSSGENLPQSKTIESRVSELRGNLKFYREGVLTVLCVEIPLFPRGDGSGD
ncbi:sensor histidine kinase [Marinimicrobium koreense]|uniref:sensor histidine kinase n=1 Tax=Marinimicrobium koreense TaxID=306545 RepID=UPI000F4CADA5|nr:histidine kinase [Marinimicrobium koreense]